MTKLIVPTLACLCIATGFLIAAQQLPIPRPAEAWTKSDVIHGRIHQVTTNPHGDIDGVELEKGLSVHIPPHAGQQLTDQLKSGTDIQVFGIMKNSSSGQHMDAKAIILGNSAYFELSKPPVGPQPNSLASRDQQSVEGTITRWLSNRHGDNDGFVFDNQTIVKFPPHLAGDLSQHVKVGQQVKVVGEVHTTPDGESHLQAIKLQSGDWETTIDRPAPPHKPHHSEESLSREILQELRAIRASLDAK